MIVGILGSLIAAFITGILVLLHRKGLTRELFDIILYYTKPSWLCKTKSSAPKINSLKIGIVRRLIKDQSRIGFHKGQFGKSIENKETEIWQNEKDAENINLKPRMYLTFWPTIVMHRHQLARRSVELARLGIQRLFSNNRVYVAQSAAPNMTPFTQPFLVSYRHSMAGALVLAEFTPWNAITHAVVDAMLDPMNNWQKKSGGWCQVSSDFSDEDLWASAYAARLLVSALDPMAPFSDTTRNLATKRLESTLSFLESQWNQKNWAFRELTPEKSAIPLFVDLADVLLDRKPQLSKKCLDKFRSWLSPSDDISYSFKEKLNEIPEEQLYARIAYAFFLGERNSEIWRKLFEYTVKTSMRNLFSSDLAFILDMSFAYQGS